MQHFSNKGCYARDRWTLYLIARSHQVLAPLSYRCLLTPAHLPPPFILIPASRSSPSLSLCIYIYIYIYIPCTSLLYLPISLSLYIYIYIYIYMYIPCTSLLYLPLSLYIFSLYIYIRTLNPNSSTRASTCTASTKSHSHFDATSFLSQRFARGFLARRKVMQWWARKMYLVTLAQALVCGVQLRERLKHKPGTRGIDSCHMCTHT